MAKTIFGIFRDRAKAEDAITALEDNGYKAEDMSIIMKNQAQAQDVAEGTGTHVAEGTVEGAATGAAIGGLAGLLIGVGAITIPGIGAFLIGGPLAAALGLSGAAATTVSGAATGALAGGVLGALVGLGIPENEARVYESEIEEGAILLAVPARDGLEQEVVDILEDFGATQLKTVDVPSEYQSNRYRVRGGDIVDQKEDYSIPSTPLYAGAKGGSSQRNKKGWFSEEEEQPQKRTKKSTKRSI